MSNGAVLGRPLPSLRRNISWIGGSYFVRTLCQWGMLAGLAKLGTAQMVGQYALGLAIMGPLMLVLGQQLYTIQITDAKREFAFDDYLILRGFGALVALAVVAAILVLSRLRAETTLVVAIVAVTKAIDSVTDTFVSAWQQQEHMPAVGTIWMANAGCSLLLLTGALVLTGSVVWAVTGSLAGSLLAFGVALLLTRMFPCRDRSGLPRTTLPRLLGLVKVALPMGGVSSLLSVDVNVPRYFIQHYLGEAALGLFAAAAYPMVVADTFVNSLAQSAAPRLARYHAAGDRAALRSLIVRLVAIGAATAGAAVCVVLVAGRQIMSLLYRPEYAAQSGVFTWIVVAISLRYCYLFVGVAVTSMRLIVIQLYLRLAVLAVLAIACPILVVRFGLLGGAWSLVVVSVFEGILWIPIGWAYVWRRPARQAPAFLEPAVY